MMKRRAGFSIIEYPVVLLILGLILLGFSILSFRLGSNIRWFLEIVGGLFTALGGTTTILLLLWNRKK